MRPLRDRLAAREDVVGIYVYGSLASYYDATSIDIEVVVLVRRDPDKAVTLPPVGHAGHSRLHHILAMAVAVN